MGAPTWPPSPQAFGAPRRSRGAPLHRCQAQSPPKPKRSERPGGAAALLYIGVRRNRAPRPKRSERPGGAVALLYICVRRSVRRSGVAGSPGDRGAPRLRRGVTSVWGFGADAPCTANTRSAPGSRRSSSPRRTRTGYSGCWCSCSSSGCCRCSPCRCSWTSCPGGSRTPCRR